MSCILCGEPIIKESYMYINKRKVKKLRKEFSNFVTSSYLEAKQDPTKNCPKVCHKCYVNKYGEIKRGLGKEQTSFLFGISGEALDEIFSNRAITLKSMIGRYGEKEGTERYNSYVEKQAYSNSFEFKEQRHGMTREEFDEYNKSRSVTKENQIKKYGKEEGLKKYNDYVEKQKVSGVTLEYFINKLGEEDGRKFYYDLNSKKAINLANFIRKYGEEEGTKKFEEYTKKAKTFSSTEANAFFEKLLKKINFEKVYTVAKNGYEFKIIEKGTNKVYSYDFVALDVNKIIEYNGSVWHANPTLYKESDTPNPHNKTLTAKEIWDYDKEKQMVAERRGFEVLYVWDTDDKEEALERCLTFLHN